MRGSQNFSWLYSGSPDVSLISLVVFWSSCYSSDSPDTPLDILLLFRAGNEPPKDLPGPGCPILSDPLIPGRYSWRELIHPVACGTGKLHPGLNFIDDPVGTTALISRALLPGGSHRNKPTPFFIQCPILYYLGSHTGSHAMDGDPLLWNAQTLPLQQPERCRPSAVLLHLCFRAPIKGSSSLLLPLPGS